MFSSREFQKSKMGYNGFTAMVFISIKLVVKVDIIKNAFGKNLDISYL